jgi:hypothetical protein
VLIFARGMPSCVLIKLFANNGLIGLTEIEYS